MSQLTTLFTDIADSLRAKEGSSGQIPAMDFPERIDGLAGKMQIVDESGESYVAVGVIPVQFNNEAVKTWDDSDFRMYYYIMPQVLITSTGLLYTAYSDSASDVVRRNISVYFNDEKLSYKINFLGTEKNFESIIGEGENGTCIVKANQPYESVGAGTQYDRRLSCINSNSEIVWDNNMGNLDSNISVKSPYGISVYCDHYGYTIYNYDLDGVKTEVAGTVPEDAIGFRVDDQGNYYFLDYSDTITKYSSTLEKISETDVSSEIPDTSSSEFLIMENENFVVINTYTSGVYSKGICLRAYKDGSMTWIYKNLYSSSDDGGDIKISADGNYLNLKMDFTDDRSVLERYYISGIGIKVWDYYYPDSANLRKVGAGFSDDYVYLVNTHGRYTKVPTEKNSNTYLVTAEKTSGGGTVI